MFLDGKQQIKLRNNKADFKANKFKEELTKIQSFKTCVKIKY